MYKWTGTIAKGPKPDTIVGILDDGMDSTIAITGTKIAGGYALVGTPGLLPEWSKLPGDDDG